MDPSLEKNIESPTQASLTDAIIISTPLALQDAIKDDYMEDIAKLPLDKQRAILEEWKTQDPKNIGIFDTIVRIKDKEVAKTDKEVEKTKEKVKDTEKELVSNNIDSQGERLNEVSRAAKLANESAEKIKQSTGNKYDAEIQNKLKSDRETPETKQFLSTLGIVDVNNVPSDKKQVVQDILMARATTQVLLDNQTQILADNPKLLEDIKNLNSLRFTLGLSDSANVAGLPKLLTDIPKSDREAIASTVKSLTKDSPDTMITRTGDRLTFQDPKNERYTYDIDMAKRPLELSKQLNGLTISRELGETRDPIREKNDKNRAEVTTLVRGLNEKKKEVLSSTMKDGSQVVSEGFSGVVSNTLSQVTLRDPAGADFSRKMLESGTNVINMEKGRLEKLVIEKKTKDPLDSDIGAIQGAIREIDAMIESMQRVKDKCIIQAEDPKNNHALWERNTNDTLKELISLGFDELGQENLNTLIRGVSMRSGNRGIWESGKLSMTDNTRLDQQLGDLSTIVSDLRKKSGKNERETLQDIRKSIAGNEGFRNIWNNSESLAKWIEKKDNNNSTVTAQNTTEKVGNKPL